MFLFKKTVALIFMPTSLIFLLLLIGVYFLWFTKKQKYGKLLTTVSFVILALGSYHTFPNILLRNLEQQYQPVLTPGDPGDLIWVVVLGGGAAPDSDMPVHEQLNSASLSRVVEGIRLYRQMSGSRLLLSGGAVFSDVTEAAVMADTAVSLGVNRQDIYLDNISKDSKDQAKEVKKIVGSDRFLLVTSAAHMPRVMALFAKQGLTPIPAPTNYWVKKGKFLNPRDFFPGSDNLRKIDNAVHEYLGILWAKLRGQA